MSDFETLCAMYDKAGIGYEVITSEHRPKLNFYCSNGFYNAIKLEVTREDDCTVCGYNGFETYHVFDKDGNLMDVYLWE